jgi:(2Fe-2S) ferredoxin
MPHDPPLFYSRHVFCCTNVRDEKKRPSCGARGSEKLRGYLKDRVKEENIEGMRINTAGCLNRCELGPVMVIYPEGVWYRYDSKADIDEILATHIRDGGRVARLMVAPDA